MSGDVLISVSPWVCGTRTKYFQAPLLLESVVQGRSWEEGIDEILELAAERARSLECNAVVGIEITCDPYHRDGGHISLTGTPALIEAWL